MCIDFDGHHSGGSAFVYVNDFCYYRNCLYTHRYKFSSDTEKINESQYIVSRPRLGSDPPFGLDRIRARQLRPTALLVSPDSSERHSCWPETQLCLPKMLLDQQIFAHECSVASYFLP